MEDGAVKNKKDPNRKGAFIKPKTQPASQDREDEIKTIILPEVVTIKELADMPHDTDNRRALLHQGFVLLGFL